MGQALLDNKIQYTTFVPHFKVKRRYIDTIWHCYAVLKNVLTRNVGNISLLGGNIPFLITGFQAALQLTVFCNVPMFISSPKNFNCGK